ncbi:heterokaryon incompatibility protein-domain-containing protein [Xylariomycetidae sp. FL2044]|nr:heterokaryon incompatibility protein-domain-containing protein [Xylariomycetidae sp. FL2044]
MRLINVDTLALEEFHDKTQTPPYAVLSHTWGTQEVSFEDWRRVKRASRKKGYDKIIATCSQAKRDGLRYVWVDTNCINKTSSSELSEAINSMFDWYRGADVCYAYLDDVEDKADGDEWLEGNPFYDSFHRSRWFSRGWTLQELLAPKKLVCYSKGWTRLGTRHDLSYRISKVTKIDELFLYDTANLQIFTASIAKRMSWASSRRTTREEDMAYCLLGLFEVNMPLLYGEGRRAFVRLQEEIMKRSVDQSLFAWSFPTREDAWEHITQDKAPSIGLWLQQGR